MLLVIAITGLQNHDPLNVCWRSCTWPYLGGFAAGLWDEVLGLVAFIEDDEAIIVGAGPVDQLLQAGIPLVTGAGQAGVSQKDHTLPHPHLKKSSAPQHLERCCLSIGKEVSGETRKLCHSTLNMLLQTDQHLCFR